MDKEYFIDWDCDCFVPLSGDEDLVEEYDSVMEKNDTPITRFNDKNGMNEYMLEYGNQCKESPYPYEHMSRDEMLEKINKNKKSTEDACLTSEDAFHKWFDGSVYDEEHRHVFSDVWDAAIKWDNE